MSGRHEPRDEFVHELERHIRGEARRRRSSALNVGPRWLPQSPFRIAAATVLLVFVSMAIGGGAVAAAYRHQANGRRELLLQSYQQQTVLAKQRLAIALEQLQNAQQRFAVGTEGPDAVADARVKVAEAQAQVKSLAVQVEEVRLAGREPQSAVSAPLVSGRDFVTERWQIEMTVPVAALDAQRSRLQGVERRAAVGVASPVDIEAARSRIGELEGAIQGLQKRIEIRRRFLQREVDAAGADLQVLEAEAEQRRATLAPRLELAKRELTDVSRRFDVGGAPDVQVAAARIRVQELQLELTKAEYDLALVRQQLGQRRK